MRRFVSTSLGFCCIRVLYTTIILYYCHRSSWGPRNKTNDSFSVTSSYTDWPFHFVACYMLVAQINNLYKLQRRLYTDVSCLDIIIAFLLLP